MTSKSAVTTNDEQFAISPGCTYIGDEHGIDHGTPPPPGYQQQEQQQQQQQPHYHDASSSKRSSMSDLYRQRSTTSGFGDRSVVDGQSSPSSHDIFHNLKTLLDSPTASATTFSSSSGSPYGGGSPYGSGSHHSPANYSPINYSPINYSPATVAESSKSSSPIYGSNYHGSKNNSSNSSPNYSVSSSGVSSGNMSEHYIDHTALLLGFRDEFQIGGGDDDGEEEMSDDDEREWNACFLSPNASLDELEVGHQGGVREHHDESVDETSSLEDDSVYVHVGEKDDESTDDDDGLQLDISCATPRDMPVTFSHDELPPSAISSDEFHNKSIIAPLKSTIASQQRPITTAITSSNNSYMLPEYGSDWTEEEVYTTLPRKNINSLENKRRSATMKALAMKERASSAFVAKTQKAKEKVHNKMKARKAQHQQQEQQQQEQQHGHQQRPNGMEITTTNYDDPSEVLSQVSDASLCERSRCEASTRSSHNSTTSFRKQHFQSKMSQASIRSKQASISVTASIRSKQASYYSVTSKSKQASKSAVSAVSSMKDKASSALSQKAHRAKEKTLGIGLPIMRVHKQSKSMMINKTRSRLSTALASSSHQPSRDEILSLLSMDDTCSDVPSIMNSEGRSDIESEIDSVIRLGGGILPNRMFDTPKATSFKSLQVVGDIHLADTLKQSNVTGEDKSFYHHHHQSSYLSPPPPITTCLSNTSSQYPTNSSQISCIDTNGFLISPTTSMDGLMMNGAACSSTLSTVGSERSFDPNSFLFLSPLSNADMDDPDYGMPELLSRSNSHNAVVMDDDVNATTKVGVAGVFSSRTKYKHPVSKLIPRLPPSPRLLPPSGKKIMRKMGRRSEF